MSCSEPEGSSSDDYEDQGPDYPPWLDKIDKASAQRHVKVLERVPDDQSLPGFVRCKAVEIPDAADFADGRTGDALQLHTLRRYTSVLVTASPTEPPYIGLIHKIWMKKDAKAVGPDTYMVADLTVECYWFYRRSEVPATAWAGELRRVRRVTGATFRYSPRHKPRTEDLSNRQLLFSSHHTHHDSETGWVYLDAVLQTCGMHWVGFDGAPPERYSIHGGRLVRVREPGFVVQGFLWCRPKTVGYNMQHSPEQKRAYKFDGDWGDKETMDIVKHMCRAYDKRAAQLQQHNRSIIDKYQRLKGEAGDVPSDDGQPLSNRLERQQIQEQQQKQQQHQQQQQQASQRPPLQDKQQQSDQQQQSGLKLRLKRAPQQQQQQQQPAASRLLSEQQQRLQMQHLQAQAGIVMSSDAQQALPPEEACRVDDPSLEDWL